MCIAVKTPSSVKPKRERRQKSFLMRSIRLAYHRLIVPMLRTTHSPEYIARAVAIGVMWSLTPLIPVQTYLLGLTWLACRYFVFLQFSFPISLAFVWLTNPLTMVPLYFVFYVTGQLLLGRWDDIAGYEIFAAQWNVLFQSDLGYFDRIKEVADQFLQKQGSALVIGCIPYAAMGGIGGYFWTLKIIANYRSRRVNCKK